MRRLAALLLAGSAALPAAAATPGEARAGALLLKRGDAYLDAPVVAADYDVTVSGPVARARVTQLFHNPGDGWVEAVYVHPLPESAAVDALKLVVGERVIVGEIGERGEAKRVFEQARADGRRAGLLEQERPNLFTTSVANIGPGESVLVQIEYQETVRRQGDRFSLRIPLVVAPRYNPAPLAQVAAFGEPRADPVPDRARIEPPVLDPRVSGPVNPVAVTVRLAAGFPLAELESPHHSVSIGTMADGGRIVRLDGPVPADRDFELVWRPAAGAEPAVGLFRERVGEADYLLAFVTPPGAMRTAAQPREIVFVIDDSGSMGGASIVQAKASLAYALGRLSPADRFNVIRFDDSMQALFAEPVSVSPRNLARAQAFVAALDADGGTEMLAPLQAALIDRRPPDASSLRQVVFITDGAIGDEARLFEAIAGGLGRSRLFMVGIGSAPNGFLMARAAELGRGAFVQIGAAAQVEARMRELFGKLESPAATGLTAALSAGGELTPDPLPDLYRGEPVVLAAKLAGLGGTLDIAATIDGRPWRVSLPLADAAQGIGLAKLWARRKIADAEVGRTLRRLAPEEADARILALALEHGLTSRLTSLVAVDRTPARPAGAPLSRADLPLNLPAGWDPALIFRSPHGSPPAARVQHAAAEAGLALPQTGTDAGLRLLAGLALCAAALLLAATARRRLA